MQKRKSIIILSILIISASLYSVYNYYRAFDEEIVTLSPNEGETKKKPKDPGGLVIPNSDSLVYEKISSASSKKRKINMLESPEAPMEIERMPEIHAKFLDSIDDILDNIEYYESEFSEDEGDDIGQGSLDFIMPNMLLSKDDALDNGSNMILIPGTKLKVSKASDSRYAMSRIKIVPEGKGGYKIQLSSARSLGDAKIQWQKIKQKHSKYLRNANLITKKLEGRNDRIFFLVMAGSYPSLNQAKLVCKKLSMRKQNCIVTK